MAGRDWNKMKNANENLHSSFNLKRPDLSH